MHKLLFVTLVSALLMSCGTPVEPDILAQKPDNDGTVYVSTPVGSLVDVTPDAANIDIDISLLDDVDVKYDLTKLSATMSYAQVAQMMFDYETYIGDTIKLNGQYYTQTISGTDIVMNVILLLDDEQCCQGYLEFKLPDGVDYPLMGQDFAIAGTYVMDSDETGNFPIIDVSYYVI